MALMQERSSFQHERVQYEFDYGNENVLQVKVGYFKSYISQKAKYEKGGGVPIFKRTSSKYC